MMNGSRNSRAMAVLRPDEPAIDRTQREHDARRGDGGDDGQQLDGRHGYFSSRCSRRSGQSTMKARPTKLGRSTNPHTCESSE